MEEENKNLEQEQEQEQENRKEEKNESSWFEKFTNTEDSTDKMDAKDIEENKVMGVLAYIGILVLIPLFAAPKSKFAKYHCNQGLMLFIIEAVCGAIFYSLGMIPTIGWIFSTIGGLIDLVCLFFLVIGIINVANGKARELPLIGGVKIINWENTENKEETKEEDDKEESKEE